VIVSTPPSRVVRTSLTPVSSLVATARILAHFRHIRVRLSPIASSPGRRSGGPRVR
jgi:hypothetical protein